MAGLSSLKNSNPLHIFPMKPSTPISKLKTLIQTFIFSHLYRATRAFAKAKSLLLEHVRDIHFLHLVEFKRGRNSKRKLYFGSFRLHYNWCASHVMPLSEESYPNSHIYYDASWNVLVPTNTNKASTTLAIPDGIASSLEYREPEGLSRYLEWLEEEKGNQESSSNEIDKLADLFIADCHEKFRLEKQESYRRFQEMMARSI
ncbi:uncharacterized protein LOC125186066 [Salvia hispanica]|uniref:uncharacterized protein LOC125186066 n=1 Tax=Salvia hispanica TaxID=49212 RepID=UPI0020091E90|nr:uncharacterized protein LOC125186066 [Salvia hispanica]